MLLPCACAKGHYGRRWALIIRLISTAVDIHAYVWPEDPSTNPYQWNPGLQTPDIVKAAQLRGMSGEVWWSEVGAPGCRGEHGPIGELVDGDREGG